MPQYRLHLLGGGGRVVRREEIEATDDAKAIATAERLSAGAAAELWQDGRKVKTFAPLK